MPCPARASGNRSSPPKCVHEKSTACKQFARPALASYHGVMLTATATRLDIRGLTVELPTETGWVRPVNDVSFSLAEGETLGIVGESGSGKTMLSLALMGLEPPGARRSGEAWLRRRLSVSPSASENETSFTGRTHPVSVGSSTVSPRMSSLVAVAVNMAP